MAMTRELGKNGKLERLLKERGLDTVEIPCITFERGVDIEKVRRDTTHPCSETILQP